MSTDPRTPPPETPRFEPEILPPEGRVPTGGFPQSGAFNWSGAAFGAQSGQRIYIGKVSPLRLFAYAFGALLVVAGVLFLFASALLVAIPIVALAVGGSFLYARLRGLFSR